MIKADILELRQRVRLAKPAALSVKQRANQSSFEFIEPFPPCLAANSDHDGHINCLHPLTHHLVGPPVLHRSGPSALTTWYGKHRFIPTMLVISHSNLW